MPPELLEQDWHGHDNPERSEKDSFKLKPEGNSTTIEFTHANVPEAEYDDFADGWRDYYFDPSKTARAITQLFYLECATSLQSLHR